MVATLGPGPTFAVSGRDVLFRIGPEYLTSQNYTPWDISPDDKRFIMVRNRATPSADQVPSLMLVENWFEELKDRTRR